MTLAEARGMRGVSAAEPLPRLLDQKAVAAELGVNLPTAARVMRQVMRGLSVRARGEGRSERADGSRRYRLFNGVEGGGTVLVCGTRASCGDVS